MSYETDKLCDTAKKVMWSIVTLGAFYVTLYGFELYMRYFS